MAAALFATLVASAGFSREASAQGFCTVAASAKQADPKHPYTKKALALWDKLSGPFGALTGRQTGLVILGPEATTKQGDAESSFKPAGVTCPGAPPVVYVTWPLLELIYGKSAYPEDFLAFVLGHELGHRINDLSIGGSITGNPNANGEHMEALADKRAAFLTSLAGYSTSRLSADDIVSKFLEAEYRTIPRALLDERKKALKQTLESFEAYESLYQSGVALAFLQEREAAERLLALADELIEGKTIPLPEIKILRAYVLMNNAAPLAPWLYEAAGALAGVDQLRCVPIFGAHTGLAQDAQQASLRGVDDLEIARKEALAKLKLADKLLTQAADYRGDDFIVQHARACLALYRGEPKEAKAQLEEVAKLLPKDAPAALQQAIKDNKALAAFGQLLKDAPPVPSSQGKGAKAWAKTFLKKAKKLGSGDPKLKLLLSSWANYPDMTQAKAPLIKGAQCAVKQPKPVSLSLPEAEQRALGACPTGWTLAHTLPAPEDAKTAQTQLGVTTCTQDGADGAKRRFVRVRLPGSMSPALSSVHLTMMFERWEQPKRLSADDWTCGAISQQRAGISDQGQLLTLIVSPSLGLMPGLLWVDAQGKVTQAATINPNVEDEAP